MIVGEIKSLWADGLIEYISDLWNIVDFIQNTFYVIWISLRIAAWWVVQVNFILLLSKIYKRRLIQSENKIDQSQLINCKIEYVIKLVDYNQLVTL